MIGCHQTVQSRSQIPRNDRLSAEGFFPKWRYLGEMAEDVSGGGPDMWCGGLARSLMKVDPASKAPGSTLHSGILPVLSCNRISVHIGLAVKGSGFLSELRVQSSSFDFLPRLKTRVPT